MALERGSRLDHYQIVETIGKGRMPEITVIRALQGICSSKH